MYTSSGKSIKLAKPWHPDENKHMEVLKQLVGEDWVNWNLDFKFLSEAFQKNNPNWYIDPRTRYESMRF